MHNADYICKFALAILHKTFKYYVMKIKDLKQGDLFTYQDTSYMDDVPEILIRVRGHYDRSSKRYSVSKYTDSCAETFVKPSRIVFPL